MPESEGLVGTPWTVRAIVTRMAASLRRQPLELVLALVVVPGWWNLVGGFTAERIGLAPGAITPGSAPPATSLALLAWGVLIWGGQLLVAIRAARGERWSLWPAFRDGVAFAPRLALTVLPLEVLGYFSGSEDPESTLQTLAVFVAPVAVMILIAKTALWAPLIVERNAALWPPLRQSWQATRGQVLRMFGLGIVLTAPLMLLFTLERTLLGRSWLSGPVFSGLMSLAVAHVYAWNVPADSPTPALRSNQNPLGIAQATRPADGAAIPG